MGHASLLVHTVDNNIDNIEILLAEKKISNEESSLIGNIINEQMNKIVENAELYYLEEDCYAKNKDVVFLLEYIYYIYTTMLKKYAETKSTYSIIPSIYRGKQINIEKNIETIQQLLNYLFISTLEGLNVVELDQIEKDLHIKLNLEKIQEHSLQTK